MLFKVFYQKNFNQVPVREFTEAMFVEGESEADVRKKLADRNFNIEFVTPVSGAYLEYEQQNENFKVETI
ncbi:DNA-dependent RNA polymerase subunit epsilon [Halalkalibacter alkaliphilus]|uniref:DNA-directed RNA polymerase subunit epsilon n=1 Tax=Halalkalibacter alkaliphilus TaxID=2917993 RepID=A0A9X2A6D4_9BACI|nr:DNA-directed RNA polymerase subunit epsilon [Halalkalibacter alkaliphilus]MCL7746296.1 DNA-dependent RNA polymerase auxiliary subunit epsilon family protein [Halalkalibacter alkaliphilus]